MDANEVAAKVWIEHPCFATVGSAELFYELILPVINAARAEMREECAKKSELLWFIGGCEIAKAIRAIPNE